MNYVRPIRITSPYSGSPVNPKIVETKRDGKIYSEAHWYCPDSGHFIRKGLIEIKDAKTGKKC